MNKARRKWLNDTIEKLEDAKNELEIIRDEEQECLDNLPENLQYSERADTMQEIIDGIDSAVCDLDDMISNLNDVVDM